MPLPDRRRPIHLGALEGSSRGTIVYVTLCSKDRKAVLANEPGHGALISAWQRHEEWKVGRYVIMPDHVHFFCSPTELTPSSLHQWMKKWKSDSARHWPDARAAPIWQRDYWDTQLRRGESYTSKWDYVLQNPVRAGLVARPDEWPFQGELNILEF